MKKTLCIAVVLMFALISVALAGVVDSRENDDITEVEIIEIEYRDPNLDPPENPEIDIIHNPPEVEQLIEDLQTTYEVTVNYVALDGTPIGEPVKQQVDVGTEFTIPLLNVAEFQPVSDLVKQTMPARDVEYTVIYLPEDFADNLIDINDYNTPLGIGNTVMNLGVCVE